MTEENRNTNDLNAGIPNQILQSIKALFENLDEQRTGLVHISQIKRRWRDNAIPNLPGVYDSFRFVAPANGLLNFDTFVLGFKTAVRRHEKNRSLEQSKRILNFDSLEARLRDDRSINGDEDVLKLVNNSREKTSVLKRAIEKVDVHCSLNTNPSSEAIARTLQSRANSANVLPSQQRVKSSSKHKHKRSLSGPEIPFRNARNKSQDDKTTSLTRPKFSVRSSTAEGQHQNKKGDLAIVVQQSESDKPISCSFDRHANQDMMKYLNDKANSVNPHESSFLKAELATMNITSSAYGDQYGSLKRPAMSTPNKLLPQTQENRLLFKNYHEADDFNRRAIRMSNKKTSLNSKKSMEDFMSSRDFEEISKNKVKREAKASSRASPSQQKIDSFSTCPRLLTTPLPPGRSIEKNFETNEPIAIKPKGFFKSISEHIQHHPPTTNNDNSTSSHTRRRRSKTKNQRRHTVADGINYALLHSIQALNSEKQALVRGLDVLQEASYWFRRRLYDVEVQRQTVNDSVRALGCQTVPMLSLDDLQQLTNQVDVLVELLSGLFEPKNETTCLSNEEKLLESQVIGSELRKENKKLTLEVSAQATKINQLEREKTQLVQQLFQAKADSQKKLSTTSNSTTSM